MGKALENPTRAIRRAAVLGSKRLRRRTIGRAHWNLRKRTEAAGYRHKKLLESTSEPIRQSISFFGRIIRAIVAFFRSLFGSRV